VVEKRGEEEKRASFDFDTTHSRSAERGRGREAVTGVHLNCSKQSHVSRVILGVMDAT
jgi:hypothetical protein